MVNRVTELSSRPFNEQDPHFWVLPTEDLRTAFDNLTSQLFNQEVNLQTSDVPESHRPIGYIDGNLRGFDDWANY